MGIETRRNGRTYLYRKERTPDGVRSVYLGPADSGLAGVLADLDADRARERERGRRRRAALFDPIDAALGDLRRSAAALRAFVRAYMVATGHRTHRGQWRRARHLRPVVSDLPPLILAPMPKAPALPVDGYRLDTDYGVPVTIPTGGTATLELAEAVRACQTDNPSPADLSRFRDALADLPPSAFAPFADRIALRSASCLLVGRDHGEPTTANAVIEAEAMQFEAELAADGGPLVRAAAAQAAVARVVLAAVTDRYGRAATGTYNIDHLDALERRVNSAQRRYLRALGTVAALRRAEGIEADRVARRGGPSPRPFSDLHSFLPAPSGDSVPDAGAVELGVG